LALKDSQVLMVSMERLVILVPLVLQVLKVFKVHKGHKVVPVQWDHRVHLEGFSIPANLRLLNVDGFLVVLPFNITKYYAIQAKPFY
jgi:hypothetical protein